MGRIANMRRTWRQARANRRGLFNAIASTAASFFGGYQSLDPRRKILPSNQWYSRSISANELASMSLPRLRALCRKLERDNPTARAAVEAWVAQVVGTGISLEPDCGDEQTDARIRAVWQEYIKSCDVSGKRSIHDLLTQAARETFTAGEFLWRTPVLVERAEAGKVPLAVLSLECEWISDLPAPVGADAITAVNGIEMDKWGRPTAYRLANPEAAFAGEIERVPASEIIHDFERRRSLQARGEPHLAPVVERIWQEGDLVDAELRSATNCAAMAMVITSELHGAPDTDTNGTTDDPAQSIAIGGVARMYPGEKVEAFSHNRPSQLIAEFRRTIRGDIASGCRVSQRWLDRDYSRANYSSMRADMLDTERLLSPVREWFGHATVGALYKKALPYLCIIAGVKMPKNAGYRLVPDEQPYVDPQKDVAAALMAIAGGLSTWEKEGGKRGEDAKKTVETLEKELKNPLLASIFSANLGKPGGISAPQKPENSAVSSDGAANE
jgi:lambda family phage portal protein